LRRGTLCFPLSSELACVLNSDQKRRYPILRGLRAFFRIFEPERCTEDTRVVSPVESSATTIPPPALLQTSSLLHLAPHPHPRRTRRNPQNSQLYIGPTYPLTSRIPLPNRQRQVQPLFQLRTPMSCYIARDMGPLNTITTGPRMRGGAPRERGGKSEMWRGRTEGGRDRNRMVGESGAKGTRSDVGGSLFFFVSFL
jgi:hypothetical protein